MAERNPRDSNTNRPVQRELETAADSAKRQEEEKASSDSLRFFYSLRLSTMILNDFFFFPSEYGF